VIRHACEKGKGQSEETERRTGRSGEYSQNRVLHAHRIFKKEPGVGTSRPTINKLVRKWKLLDDEAHEGRKKKADITLKSNLNKKPLTAAAAVRRR